MRNFLIILSLVNLCFLSVWRELIFSTKSDSYWLPTFQFQSYVAAIINVVGISIVVWCFATLIKQWSPIFWKYLSIAGLLFALIFPINYLRKIAGIHSNVIYWLTSQKILFPAMILGLIIIGALLYGLLKKRLVEISSGALIILSPFALLTLGQVSWKAIESFGENTLMAHRTKMEILDKPVSKLQRVVWIIFDELDLRLAFINRPDNVNLPEFDQFRNESLFATQALSHSKNTEEAIPSYLTGKLVATAIPMSPDTLRLTYENSEEGRFHFLTEEPNFFSAAYDVGARTAIIGFYHPYCRLFGNKASFCSQYTLNTYTPQVSSSLSKEWASQISGISPFSGRNNAISTYKGMLKAALEISVDSHYDVLYIHASVPHGPDVYFRDSGSFSVVNISKVGYFDNLVLADQFFGRLKRSMKSANLWDTTTVLVTSDHEWRHVHLYDDKRVRKVPFLIKMAHQDQGVVYEKAFSPMLVTKDLLLQILSGTLSDTQSVVNWLDHQIL